ncbi:Metallo-dependent phosphatase-like [Phytophthora cactorum]|nr:Metallo-dependent phosphatase-like [Phytophthora cactorum]
MKLRFAVNLGDLIDARTDLRPHAVGPVHHLVGNHELYNFPASVIQKELLYSLQNYYDFQVPEAPKFRFVVLDCYGLSILGREKNDPVYQEALALLRRVNPNENLNSPTGLVEEQRRFVAFNGAVDREQMKWLEGTLVKATEAGENHLADTFQFVGNYPEVLELIRRFPRVRVVFSGHSHADGYMYAHEGMHNKGVHFVVFDAILECSPSETAHALVHVFEDKLVVQGYGKVPTRELRFPEASDE